jgi:hypothetical protein
MPILTLQEISAQDRATYRRWVRAVFCVYGTIAVVLAASAFYQSKTPSTQEANASAMKQPAAIGQNDESSNGVDQGTKNAFLKLDGAARGTRDP